MNSFLIVPNRIRYESHSVGMDSVDKCFDLAHFKSYKKEISYEYNSNGFRDEEWPDDLSDVVWCVGDSYTVGIGQPYNETWPKILEGLIGKRCLNVGEDGCSNDTILLRVKEIYNTYKPKNIVIMWSFLSRRRVKGENVHHDKAQFGPQSDLENFAKNFNECNKFSTNVVNLLIPHAFLDSNVLDNEFIVNTLKRSGLFTSEQIGALHTFKQLDFARDYYHFDIMTSKFVAEIVAKKILDLTNEPK